MITLYQEDGTPVEVPSDEEIAVLKQSQEKVVTLLKEKEDLEKDVNPNWKEIRETNKKLKEALKAQGKDVDDNGNIIEKNVFNKEEVLGEAKKMFQEETFGTEKERLLASYSDTDKQTISIYLDKLMSGEERNISNLHKFMDQATAFVFPNQDNKSKRSAYSSNGHAANLTNDAKPSESAVAMGNQFGHSEEELTNASSEIKF